MTEELKLATPVKVMQPTSYHFSFTPYGWAVFTINDETGEFLISSDWGDYAHRWPSHPDHLGAPSLTAFLAQRGDSDYITRKLHYGREDTEYNGPATVSEVRRFIVERRRDDGLVGDWQHATEGRTHLLTRQKARELWDAASHLDHRSAEEARQTVEDLAPDLVSFLEGELWEFFVHSPTSRFLFLREQLIPFFQSWLRDNVVQKRSA